MPDGPYGAEPAFFWGDYNCVDKKTVKVKNETFKSQSMNLINPTSNLNIC